MTFVPVEISCGYKGHQLLHSHGVGCSLSHIIHSCLYVRICLQMSQPETLVAIYTEIRRHHVYMYCVTVHM